MISERQGVVCFEDLAGYPAGTKLYRCACCTQLCVDTEPECIDDDGGAWHDCFPGFRGVLQLVGVKG